MTESAFFVPHWCLPEVYTFDKRAKDLIFFTKYN